MANPGKIVKKIAIVLFVIMIVLSIVLANYVGDELPDDTEVIGTILTIIIGVGVSACFSVLIYAFGELVEDVHAIRNKLGTTKEIKAKREADIKAKFQEKLQPSRVSDKPIVNDFPIYTSNGSTTCDSTIHEKYKDNLGNNIGAKTKDGHWEIESVLNERVFVCNHCHGIIAFESDFYKDE